MSKQFDLFNPPDPNAKPIVDNQPPMHTRRSILRGAVDLASHGAIRDLDHWLLQPLEACGGIAPIALARDHWPKVSEWVRTLFLTPLEDRAYILFDDRKAQMDMSKVLQAGRTLLRE